jgi:hypothetical protein
MNAKVSVLASIFFCLGNCYGGEKFHVDTVVQADGPGIQWCCFGTTPAGAAFVVFASAVKCLSASVQVGKTRRPIIRYNAVEYDFSSRRGVFVLCEQGLIEISGVPPPLQSLTAMLGNKESALSPLALEHHK